METVTTTVEARTLTKGTVMETAVKAVVDGTRVLELETLRRRCDHLIAEAEKNSIGPGWASRLVQDIIDRHGQSSFFVNRATEVMRPHGLQFWSSELERSGPSEYHQSILKECFFGTGQKAGDVYEHLKKTELIQSCLSIHDGEEIRKRGTAFFRESFRASRLFLWKSISYSSSRGYHVPIIARDGQELTIQWSWLLRTYHAMCSTPMLLG